MAELSVLSDETFKDPAIARNRRRRYGILAAQILLMLSLFIVWELLSPYLDRLVFSSPHAILLRLWGWTLDGTLLRNLYATAQEITLGYLGGGAAGVLFGLLIGSYPLIARIIDPILMGINGIPKIAFGPLFIVWFGINMIPKVVMAGVLVFFFVFMATYEGARSVDRDLLRTIRLMGATQFQQRILIIIPSALPSILLGLKLAIPQALVGAIIGELIVANRGVGYLIEFSASQLDSSGVYAGLFVLMVLAIAANSVVNFATQKTSNNGGETDDE